MADTKRTIKCPACEKDMHKVLMPKSGINIDICLGGCGGMFFDNREFERFDDKDENIDAIIDSLEGKVFASVNADVTRICPVCSAKMVKNYVSQKHKVMIDECYSCGGKFLDNNELEATRGEYGSAVEKKKETEAFVKGTVSKAWEAESQFGNSRTSRHPRLKEVFDYVINTRDN